MCYTKLPTKECQDQKVVGHSNSNKANPNDIKIRTKRALHTARDTNGTRNSRESEPLMHDGSKAMSKVTTFGPALALRARKMYQIKRAQHVNNNKTALALRARKMHQIKRAQHVTYNKTCFDFPKGSNQHFARHIFTNQSALPVNNNSSLAQTACSMRNTFDTSTQEKRVQHPSIRQPFLRIASISPRPNGKNLRKPRNSSTIEYSGYSNEGFVKDETLNRANKIRNQGATIFELLGQMSSLSI